MALAERSPRAVLAAGLLALVPVSWYAVGGSASAGAVSALNVAIVLVALYLAFGPAVGGGHGDAA